MFYAPPLYTTPKWIVCLPLQHEGCYVIQSLVRLSIMTGRLLGPTTGGKCLSQGLNDTFFFVEVSKLKHN